MRDSAVLLIDCPDRKGLVAHVSGLLYQHGANILHADQHQDHGLGLFFMRVEWGLSGNGDAAGRFDMEAFTADFAPLAAELDMHWTLTASTINVHHSFLPAFTGARPYHAAHARGVKLIGATSHYVTEVLDDGPIIEQDVARISHRDQVEDLVARGRDLERMVLSRAVRWHLDRRILCYGNKTVIFD
jgi:formyltetrahydrofolate hydrolase